MVGVAGAAPETHPAGRRGDAMTTLAVIELGTGREFHYVGLSPRAAVAAAFALHGRGDANTWDYAAKYEPLVETPGRGVYRLGDFCCREPAPARFAVE